MILSESPAARPADLWKADEMLEAVRSDKSFRVEADGRGAAGFAEQAPTVWRVPAPAAMVPAPSPPPPAAVAATPAAAPARVQRAAPVATPAIDASLLQQSRDAGYAEGLAAGREAMQAEMRPGLEKEKQAVKKLLTELRQALGDPRAYFAPLERLAVHLAEQLVRGELTLSSVAIRRLVENCLLEIDHRGEKLTLRLHPEDLEKFSQLLGELPEGVELRRDPGLGRGSVRLEMADGAIEDLIEHRLAALARSLLGAQAAGQIKYGEGGEDSEGGVRGLTHDDVAPQAAPRAVPRDADGDGSHS